MIIIVTKVYFVASVVQKLTTTVPYSSEGRRRHRFLLSATCRYRQEIGSLHPVMHSSRGSRYRRKKHHLYQPRAIPFLRWPISTPLPVSSLFIDCQWAQRVWSDIWTVETMSLWYPNALGSEARSCPQATSSALAEARRGRRAAGDETLRYATFHLSSRSFFWRMPLQTFHIHLINT